MAITIQNYGGKGSIKHQVASDWKLSIPKKAAWQDSFLVWFCFSLNSLRAQAHTPDLAIISRIRDNSRLELGYIWDPVCPPGLLAPPEDWDWGLAIGPAAVHG
jgi:hypothetical protein